MTKQYKYMCDAGHGWMSVKRVECIDHGIIDKISHYSYQNGASVYLEEDCDMSLFFNTYNAKFGTDPSLKTTHTDKRSPIRSYASFKI